MRGERYIINGTLSNQTTVILDAPIALPVHRVRITLEPLPPTLGPLLAELAEAQGVTPVKTLDDLWADFWPEKESVDDFIEPIYQGRHEAIEL